MDISKHHPSNIPSKSNPTIHFSEDCQCENLFTANCLQKKSQLMLLYHLIMCLDHKSCAETGQELMRPYLHQFLTSAYEDYDIVIWCMELLSSFFLLFCVLY